jgi:hypothetical protein
MAVSFIGGVPGENHRPVTSHWQTLSHNVVSSDKVCQTEEMEMGSTIIVNK